MEWESYCSNKSWLYYFLLLLSSKD